MMKKGIRIIAAVVAAVCLVIMGLVIYGTFAMPSALTRYEHAPARLSALYSCEEGTTSSTVSAQGKNTQEIKALGVIPVKKIRVTDKARRTVAVSGEVFGIKLYTDGVLVVGLQSVDLGEGEKRNPAQEAGLKTGDIIVSINNIRVFTSDEVTALLNDNNGLPYSIKIKRDGRYKTFTLQPVFSPREGCYKAGLWVRDSGAGIGTMTFYNTECGTFASLGHQINDVDTNALMPLLQGEAVSATVTKVQKGYAGTTGSLWCDFEDYTLGKLLENTPTGLYGAYSQVSDTAQRVAVAAPQEVHKGDAVMLSTIEGNTPQRYAIEITHISYRRGEEQKDLIFKIKDKALLAKTGGIVQGMSGSPILQDGRLVGAVTHVIVNQPTKGYAVFAQTMVEKSESIGAKGTLQQ